MVLRILNAEKILKQYIDHTRDFPCTEEMKQLIVQTITSGEVTSALFDELYSILFQSLHDLYFPHFLRSHPHPYLCRHLLPHLLTHLVYAFD